MNYQKELDFAKALALEAGKIMRRYFRAEDMGTKRKEDHTPVTAADLQINSLVIKRVREAFPNDGVLGEEESYETNGNRVWVLDPIDGTMPFSLGMPISTFMLALIDRSDGQPVMAVVYDPYLNHLYTAQKGRGAFLNNDRLNASKSESLSRTYASLYGPVAETDSFKYVPGDLIESLRPWNTKVINISSGGYTAVKVASGDFALVAMANGLPWDSAAPALIVKEAGGVVTDLSGKRRRLDEVGLGCVMAANQGILDQLLNMIKK